MGNSLEVGAVRIAHTHTFGNDADEAVVAEFDTHGVLVSWPRTLDFVDAFRLNDDGRVIPEPLILRDVHGWLTLTDGYTAGASASTLGSSIERLRYSRAIHSGSRGADYSKVNGMTSEIDGLAKWAKRVPVTSTLMFGEADGRVEGVSITAKNLESLPLGGPFDLELITSYTHNPTPKDGIFSISTALQLRTRSSVLEDWKTHQQTHRMIQDLLYLVYGKACGTRLISVMREDDQERPPRDERRFWREAYEPTFGRTSDSEAQLNERDEPLFYLDEADADCVSTWLAEFSYWSRPTWIAMSAIHPRHLPVESRLLQVAVALEALGYAIGQKSDFDQQKQVQYETYLSWIFDFLGYEPSVVVGETGDRDSWCKAFNAAYKGVKHADNDLTDGREAWTRAREGLILIRCWLAAVLGVPRELVERRFREGRVHT